MGKIRSKVEIDKHCDSYIPFSILAIVDESQNPDVSISTEEKEQNLSSLIINLYVFDQICRNRK